MGGGLYVQFMLYSFELVVLHLHVFLHIMYCASLFLQVFEQWIDDIAQDKVTLDRIKLCICGHPRVGKSAMRQSLSRPYLQVIKVK